MRRIACLLSVLLMASWLLACSTNPATGKMQLNALSDEKEEVAMGVQAAPGVAQQYGGEIPSPAVQAYVSDVGKRLAAVSERPTLPWEFHALNSPIINAFSLPGGKVFITRGLLERL